MGYRNQIRLPIGIELSFAENSQTNCTIGIIPTGYRNQFRLPIGIIIIDHRKSV